jgi:hypothetical protein
MASHVEVLDRIQVESRVLDQPVVLLCRADKFIEVYAVTDDGREEFAGFLNKRHKAAQEKVDALLAAITKRIKEDPVSRRSHAWLQALDHEELLPQ